MAEEIEEPRPQSADYWHDQIKLASNEEHNWRQRADRIVDRYRDEAARGDRRFNILWANLEILQPATLSQLPEPSVQRRFLDSDPVARQVAMVLERGLSFAIEDYDFLAPTMGVRDDALLVGRGVARVKYEAQFAKRYPRAVMAGPMPMMGEGEPHVMYVLDGEYVYPEEEDEKGPYVEEKVDESVRCEYVFWRDYRQQPARRWSDVSWVAFRHAMLQGELVEQFGAKGREIPLTLSHVDHDDEDGDDDEPKTHFKRAEVWEVWDKESRQRIWVASGYKQIIEAEDDPLELDGFFPMSEPLQFITTTDTLVPLPEYCQYQDQAMELDEVSGRIYHLVEMLKVAGLYDAVEKSLPNLSALEDGELYPTDAAQSLRDKGGLEASIFFMPIEQTAKVLAGLIQHRESLKAEIYELTGISDVIRGVSDSGESATASRIKGQYAGMRLDNKTMPMQNWIRDLMRLKAEVMAQLFSPETLSRMTGIQVTPPMVALLRDESLRSFRVEIETDSTVKPDQVMEKQEAIEFVSSITGFLEQATAIGQASPAMVPMLMDMLKFAARRFKVSRQLEDSIERATQAVQQQLQQPQQQGPSPEQIKAQVEMRKAAMKAQTDRQGQQTQAEIARMKAESEALNNYLDVVASN